MVIGKPTEECKIFVGMHRPMQLPPHPWRNYPHCPHGHSILRLVGDVEKCLSQGCFDLPIYASLEEMVAAGEYPSLAGEKT